MEVTTLTESFTLIASGLIAIATTTEAMVELLKGTLPPLTAQQDRLLAFVVAMIIGSITFCLVIQPFPTLAYNVATAVVGGVVGSRGSNFVHDFLKIVEGYASVMKLRGQVANEVANEQ